MNVEFLNETYEVDSAVMQMEHVASDLVALLHHAGVSREELAEKMQHSIEYINRLLSGDINLSITDITKISEALGYTFDVVFHNEDYEKPKQPWEISKERLTNTLKMTDILKHGTDVSSLIDIPLSSDGLYFIRYNNINKLSKTDNTIFEYALYNVSHGIGDINNQFHFDVQDYYVNITYVKLVI